MFNTSSDEESGRYKSHEEKCARKGLYSINNNNRIQ
jgi:hypothetical protein